MHDYTNCARIVHREEGYIHAHPMGRDWETCIFLRHYQPGRGFDFGSEEFGNFARNRNRCVAARRAAASGDDTESRESIRAFA